MLRATGLTDEDLARPLDRRRQHLDRDRPLQLPPARARRSTSRRESAPPAARRSSSTPISISDGITMGMRGHARLAGQPRGHRRFDRAGRARQPVRRAGRAGRLRQDHPGRGDGAGAPRHPRPGALRRLDRAGPLARPRRHDPGRVRGGRRARRRHDDRRRARRARAPGLPGRRRLRRPVHRQHDGDRVRGARHLAVRQRQRAGRRRRQGGASRARPARW